MSSTGTSGEFDLQQWTEQVKDALTQYERDHATHRASRDWLIRLWHDGLKHANDSDTELSDGEDEMGEIVHRVVESMDHFLKRSKL